MKDLAKLTVPIGLLALSTLASAAQTNMAFNIKFQQSPSVFVGPTNVTMAPDGYNFYYSTNVALPLAQWTYFTTAPTTTISPFSSNYVPVTNWSGVASFPISPFMFCAAVYTNQSGASFFSNLAGCQLTLFSPALNQFTAH